MPEGNEDDSSFWRPRLLRTTLLALALAGLYLLTFWLMQPAIAALPSAGSTQYRRGPLTLLLIIGGLLGWLLAIANERIWNWSGGVLFVPVLAQTMLAAVLTALLCTSVFDPLSDDLLEMLVLTALATLIAAAVKIYWEAM